MLELNSHTVELVENVINPIERMILVHFLHESTFFVATLRVKNVYIARINAYHSAMDISALQLFIEVVQQGSFAAVARDRNLDPSSVSRTIAGLEAELGVRLFHRTTRRLLLTEAGTIYFDRIEPLLEEMQQAVHVAKDSSGEPNGTLRITASVSFGQKCIVPLLAEFQSIYPDLTVDLHLTDAIVNLFAEKIDVAIRLGLLADSTLVAQQLVQTRYLVCASPQYLERYGQLKNPSEIESHNCLLFPLEGFRARWIFRDKGGTLSTVPVHSRTIISNAIALQQCAIVGMGLALLPHWLISEDLNSGRLLNLFPAYEVTATDFSTAAWLVYPSRNYVPLKVRAFIKFVKQAISE
jgi:DNA-binding transcriptional LysR family regulator